MLVVVAVAIAALASSCHTVDEGKIGIYFVNGALTNKVRLWGESNGGGGGGSTGPGGPLADFFSVYFFFDCLG